MSDIKFTKVGSAYVADLDYGDERFWLRRISGRWDLIWQHRDPLGDRIMTRIGRFRRLDEAMTDAKILARL